MKVFNVSELLIPLEELDGNAQAMSENFLARKLDPVLYDTLSSTWSNLTGTKRVNVKGKVQVCLIQNTKDRKEMLTISNP